MNIIHSTEGRMEGTYIYTVPIDVPIDAIINKVYIAYKFSVDSCFSNNTYFLGSSTNPIIGPTTVKNLVMNMLSILEADWLIVSYLPPSYLASSLDGLILSIKVILSLTLQI